MILRCSNSALNCRIASIILPGNFLFLSNSQNPQFLGQHHLVNHYLEQISLRFSGAANSAKTDKTWKENLLKLNYPRLSLRRILCKTSELVRNLPRALSRKATNCMLQFVAKTSCFKVLENSQQYCKILQAYLKVSFNWSCVISKIRVNN